MPADEIAVVATRYQVGTLQVELRDSEKGLWAVTYAGSTINKDGEWEYEPLPSSRSEAYMSRTRFPLEEALEIAKAACLSRTM